MTRRVGSERRVPLTPSFLIAAASAFVDVDLTGIVKSGARSDAAFVNHVGRWSHYGGALKRSRWPVPEVHDADTLAQWAGARGMLTADPLEGDLFLIWSAAVGRFVRTGVVASVEDRKAPLGAAPADLCEVIEGGSSEDRGAWCARVNRHLRHFLPCDRFVRWVEPARLDPEVMWQWVTDRVRADAERGAA